MPPLWNDVKKKLARARRIIAKKRREYRARRHAGAQDLHPVDTGLGNTAVSTSVTGNIRHFANPGPAFENADPGLRVSDGNELERRVKAIAFYLPQFHTFPQNDEWWGQGFTEWRNVARGTPRFAGHYQPRIPRDLGFYDLTDDHTLQAQAALAKANGIDAFCFYYYWFDGKRLMDKPLDRFAESNIDQSFCIMWANENWTRTWDGMANDVLMEQNYRDSDEAAFIADTAQYMAHERYVRVQGRPLFILYRPGLLPEPTETLARWRTLWTEALGVEPWVLMVQGFGDTDPSAFGLDGAVEFPPHKVCADVPDINAKLTVLDPEFRGHVRDYSAVVDQSLKEAVTEFPLIKTVSPSWDNDARREGCGMTLHGSTPAEYERWLNGTIAYAKAHPFKDEPVVFINAWNEWAEGAYLEPDVHYGHAYLNATARAVTGRTLAGAQNRILLVGHDAHQHGAQMLLLHLAQCFREQLGFEVTTVLKSTGVLVPRYREFGKTFIVDEIGPEGLNKLLAECGAEMAICNTSVTGDLVPQLKRKGFRVISLIHEMPTLIEEYGLQPHLEAVAREADHVLFPSPIVQAGFHRFVNDVRATEHIKPQGTYKRIVFDARARTRIRSALNMSEGDHLIMNAGYADLRKGFDLFMQSALRLTALRDDVHFVWVGALSADMKRWVQSDLSVAAQQPRIHLTGFSDNMADYYSASDALLLTSREDPYPTVVLEAMNVGMPVVLFRQCTGFDQVMSEHGYLAERSEIAELDELVQSAIGPEDDARRQARKAFVERECQLTDYCVALSDLLRAKVP